MVKTALRYYWGEAEASYVFSMQTRGPRSEKRPFSIWNGDRNVEYILWYIIELLTSFASLFNNHNEMVLYINDSALASPCRGSGMRVNNVATTSHRFAAFRVRIGPSSGEDVASEHDDEEYIYGTEEITGLDPKLRSADGKDFGNLCRIYTTGLSEALNPDKEKRLADIVVELLRWVLENADVVCSNLKRTADTTIHAMMRPIMIRGDEQGRACAADVRSLYANFLGCHRMVWLGDPHQSGPQVRSNACDNGFAPQLDVTELSRMMIAEFLVAEVSVKHR
nr:regulator of nonsense transcripts 1 like [Quercus suber]